MQLARRFRTFRPYVILVLVGAFLYALGAEHTDAHILVTSKYDYNKDIFPLLRDHCGSCHVPGGSAPMSLMTYSDAMAWGESIREELTAGRMPPWPVDPASPPVKGGQPISSRDIDMMVIWAAGGAPQGDLATTLPAVTYKSKWKLGPPDLKIPMDSEHTLAPGKIEETVQLSLATGLTETKWVKATDLMPGTASIVRDAIVSIENGPVLAMWEPGSEVIAAPSGAAFRLAPGAKIQLQIHYKKHFDQEQTNVSDKSTIGLYFTDPPPSGRELQSFAIDPPKAAGVPSGPSTFAGVLPGAARILALRPMLDRAYASVNVEAITPSGTHVPLLRLMGPRPQWLRRYWLQEPMELPAGTKIDIQVTPLPDYTDEPKVTEQFQLQVALDFVSL
jgi:hypothetical protein